MRNYGFDEINPDSEPATNVNAAKKGLNAGEYIAFFFGEAPALQLILSKVNWLPVTVVLGLIIALIRLILIANPSVCYLLARDQVNGYEVTLPEAMAAVRAWSWFNLILTPLLLAILLSVIAWLLKQITRWFGGKEKFHLYLGIVTSCALLLTFGQIIGYITVNAQDLKSINDISDLTPGVGLGLLPLLSLERVGRFFHEVLRGLDIFGIWTMLLLTAMFQVMENFKKGKALLLAGVYYSAFIAARWVIEGPGSQLWHYFWNTGNY